MLNKAKVVGKDAFVDGQEGIEQTTGEQKDDANGQNGEGFPDR